MIGKCCLLQFPTIADDRGAISIVEQLKNIPFDIKRLFYSYNITPKEKRGDHAHKQLHQVVIAMSGSFDLIIDDGINKETIHLNNPGVGLHIPPMVWTIVNNFSDGAVCFVVASDVYDESDYYRDYDEFLTAARNA